jgi:hypothetical protein
MTSTPDPAVAAVIALERRLLDAEVRSSAESLDALLDPEFREVGASGRIWDRESVIRSLAAEGASTEPIRDEGMEGRSLAADLVLLSYLSDSAGRRAHRTSLWRHDGSRWRLLHHQGTLAG